MANLTIDPKRVRPISIIEQVFMPSTISGMTAGTAVGIDAATGNAMKAKATTAALAECKGIRIGYSSTDGAVVRKGTIDIGDALDALQFGAKVYLSDTDGLLSDTPGTVNKVIGEVVPQRQNVPTSSNTPDKALRVDL
jgi:hypothetical protein